MHLRPAKVAEGGYVGLGEIGSIGLVATVSLEAGVVGGPLVFDQFATMVAAVNAAFAPGL